MSVECCIEMSVLKNETMYFLLTHNSNVLKFIPQDALTNNATIGLKLLLSSDIANALSFECERSRRSNASFMCRSLRK